jgi:subtilase family serine protease
MFSLTLSVALAQAQEGRAPGQPAAQAVVSSRPPGTFVRPGSVIVPASAVARPEDAGKVAHTNIKIFAPAGVPLQSVSPDNTFAEYPASIACVYKVGPSYAGCVPANNGKHASGGWGAIAIVDAYDDPTAASDLAFFDTFFGLPKANFTTIYANSSWGAQGSLGLTASCSGVPANANTTGWDLEESLDIEWAHAMAPSAHIILVEACSSSLNDLAVAEEIAGSEVGLHGGGDVSNSWGTGEFTGENQYDPYFYQDHWPHTSYFASAGDGGWGASYPSSSPWVVSAGGTTINRDASGNFLSESCWAGSGGGVSAQEIWQNPPDIQNGMGPWSDFQYPMVGGVPFTTGARMTPDMSFDADPASGVFVRDTDSGGSWFVVGGTSLSSPALAGLVNSAGQKLGQAPGAGLFYSTGENNLIYSQLFANAAYPGNFYDVTTGSNGSGHNAGPGYDQCTGVGSPRGKLGK